MTVERANILLDILGLGKGHRPDELLVEHQPDPVQSSLMLVRTVTDTQLALARVLEAAHDGEELEPWKRGNGVYIPLPIFLKMAVRLTDHAETRQNLRRALDVVFVEPFGVAR